MKPENTAFIFPGQGSQKLGMGEALAQAFEPAAQIFRQADQLLGFPLSQLCWRGPQEALNDTANTQPALLAHSIAALRVLEDKHPHFKPAYAAGHSLGELSALVAGRALDFESALGLVRQRGKLMKAAGERSPGGMAALLGLDSETVERICHQASAGSQVVQIANDNCPGQLVISGARAALNRAMDLAEAAGAKKVVRLAVSIAAHSPLMAEAQDEFNRAVAAAPIEKPAIPVIGNVNAAPLTTPEAIRSDLQAQLTERVRWTETITTLLEQGVTCFVEIGSGKVLSSLVKRINRKTTRLALGSPEDFETFAAMLEG